MADVSLNDLLSFGSKIQKRIETGELTRSDKDFNPLLNKAIDDLSVAHERVETIGLFSRNEDIEEVATSDLKFMLVPAVLGNLLFQLMEGDRLTNLMRSKEYLIIYLQRCYDYAITTEPPVVSESSEGAGLAPPTPPVAVQHKKTIQQLSAERDKKMAKYRSKKELEKKLKEVTSLIDSAPSTHAVDEEILRDHTLTSIKLWEHESRDCIGTISQEIQLLSMRPPTGATPPVAEAPPKPRPSQKPLVITREMLKGNVFGAGYPSLPSMTVEEFYDKTYKEQIERQQQENTNKTAAHASHEEVEEKELTEEEEQEKLRKEREFDDYKDDHRRGWGNRKNMG
ncbi:PREDICTED: immunoglobulin-binding protein 1-like [Amphimedon queenslandica]|uniref:Immunoglobulin-binding protein 1 n=1 Tax=Amphimedon queenslandica TaxID=400682 RepID=A0A1X7TLJ8_AMPQE|nr:PREDICTED: immunoglobulin-binding protein 1-like [Amphimedon queenslandica]|eukprot:XP_011407291.1 PREDICTED: immunoglobulin-binding protein 1-like [Amphimedon queenslandica]